jgi:hypothetical protein
MPQIARGAIVDATQDAKMVCAPQQKLNQTCG